MIGVGVLATDWLLEGWCVCRLAMVAFLGFCSQAANTGVGPLQNLQEHIADPVHKNSKPPFCGPSACL